jgi:hypothetical protein
MQMAFCYSHGKSSATDCNRRLAATGKFWNGKEYGKTKAMRIPRQPSSVQNETDQNSGIIWNIPAIWIS